MKKYIAEFIGTFTLVFIGCGTAMLVGCDAANGCGYILTAFAFGMTIIAMAYSIGNISGCHINPAVSLGVLINDGMTIKDFFGYVVAQCFGAFAGSGLLAFIFKHADITDKTLAVNKIGEVTGGFGTNGLGGVHDNVLVGFVVEVVLTCIFLLTILGVTSKKAGHGSFAGVVIGFTLFLVHIIGIGLTGTSVNPARSLGPALVAALNGSNMPIISLMVFIVAPLVGAVIAALIHKFLESGKEDVVTEKAEASTPAKSTAPSSNNTNRNNNRNNKRKRK